MVWVLDRAHTEIRFAVRQLLVSTVTGRFRDFVAEIALDAEHPERSSVRAVIEVGSISTGNPVRDAHLRSSAFFDVARFPRIVFASKHVGQVGQDSFWLSGDLSIHGVTQEVTLRGRFPEPIADLAGKSPVRFSMEAQVDREDFGLTWNAPLDGGGVVVGKLVTITIDATLVETGGLETGGVETPAAARSEGPERS